MFSVNSITECTSRYLLSLMNQGTTCIFVCMSAKVFYKQQTFLYFSKKLFCIKISASFKNQHTVTKSLILKIFRCLAIRKSEKSPWGTIWQQILVQAFHTATPVGFRPFPVDNSIRYCVGSSTCEKSYHYFFVDDLGLIAPANDKDTLLCGQTQTCKAEE